MLLISKEIQLIRDVRNSFLKGTLLSLSLFFKDRANFLVLVDFYVSLKELCCHLLRE